MLTLSRIRRSWARGQQALTPADIPPHGWPRRAHAPRAGEAVTGARRARHASTVSTVDCCPLTGPVPLTVLGQATPIYDAVTAWAGPATMSLRLPKAV